MTPPDLPPLMLLECAACGEPITVEQFAQSVQRIETAAGGRQITSGPYHAERVHNQAAPYPVEHSPRPGVTVVVFRGCTPGKTETLAARTLGALGERDA